MLKLQLFALEHKNMPKVGFISLGCPKNLVDSEVMMGILARSGYELTPRADDADVLVVNTCSFIEPRSRSPSTPSSKWPNTKNSAGRRKLVVAGCLVERYRQQIREQIPEVDAVIGTGEVERILTAIEGELRALRRPRPPFSIMTPRRACSPRPAMPPISRLPKAAIIPARSASFRSSRRIPEPPI